MTNFNNKKKVVSNLVRMASFWNDFISGTLKVERVESQITYKPGGKS